MELYLERKKVSHLEITPEFITSTKSGTMSPRGLDGRMVSPIQFSGMFCYRQGPFIVGGMSLWVAQFSGTIGRF